MGGLEIRADTRKARFEQDLDYVSQSIGNMGAIITSQADTAETHEFVTEADWIPDFWNFLLGLDKDDLIAELVQNDLDQKALCTVITFEQDRLICEGNGKPVDANGWRWLRVIRGAGDNVPAKKGKIGVKNHGLKAAFTIGDTIQVLSAGKKITQTLYANGHDKPPRPGASPEPRASAEAPLNGCRVVISFRQHDLEPREGEAIRIGCADAKAIQELFKSLCAAIPEQFAGIVSPEIAPRYEIIIRHWELGEARYRFTCSRPRKIGKSMESFRRRCEVTGSVEDLPDGLEEEAIRRLTPLTGRLRERIPDFYLRKNRFFVEVSWSIDRRGKPKTAIGRFRYPIGYPITSHESLTGHGVYFNAPFVSDNKRHAPARNDPTNPELRQDCEQLLVDAIALSSVSRWGPASLNPLVPRPDSSNEDEAVRPLLATLAERGALPTLAWRNACRIATNVKKIPNARRLALSDEGARYKLVIPVTTWNDASVHSSLVLVCPPNELQLHPRVHARIISLLSDKETRGFYEAFITFDNDDAFSIAAGKGNQYFSISANQNERLSNPVLARAYLDLIKDALDNDELESTVEDDLLASLRLPDVGLEATPMPLLHASASVPPDIPGLKLPPLLHPSLTSHPLLRRRKWRRPTFTLGKFLDDNALDEADVQTRRRFWEWLRVNETRIKPKETTRLFSMTIWPDERSEMFKLSELCDPKNRGITEILKSSIHVPNEQMRRSRLTALGKKGQRRIRRVPSANELRGWLADRIASLAVAELPDREAVNRLERFEVDLAVLLQDQAIARVLNTIDSVLPAFAEDGSVRWRTRLVLADNSIKRLGLPARFVIRRSRASDIIQKLSPALAEPTTSMLRSAFEEDGANFGALQTRLSWFLKVTESSDVDRQAVRCLPIIPLNNQPCSPSDLAFIGSKGDYWGLWKQRLTTKGLSQDDQRRYLEIGVTSATPTIETSQQFFEWLSDQSADVLQLHLHCVLRHILHNHGPVAWAEVHTDIPFVPAKNANGVRLVSLRTARRASVYLDDLPNLAERILNTDNRISFVIDRVKEVTEPISIVLRDLGVRSLRESLGEAENVNGIGHSKEATGRVVSALHDLRSNRIRSTLQKRLNQLGVNTDLIRHDWFNRVSGIRAVQFADQVKATFRFHGRKYSWPVDAGFDHQSGTFWIQKDAQDTLSSFCESLAEVLILKNTARPVDRLALQRALQMEISDPSFGRVDFNEPEDTTGSTTEEQDSSSNEDEEEPGESVFGHAPFEPDPTKNLPEPTKFESTPGTESGGGSVRIVVRETKPAPALEQEHVELLKTKHYASHCQMCLCERSPSELAPTGSYVEWQEVRRRIIEAHHLDPKSGGGARHAGNLILLCKFHHDNYGRRLTREALTKALRESSARTITFSSNSADVSDIVGRVIRVSIPDTGDVVALFFTKQHSEFWLSKTRNRK